LGELDIWERLFAVADREWAELEAKANKGKAPLAPGYMWQTKRVKRGGKTYTEEVQVLNQFRAFEKIMKDEAMRDKHRGKPTPLIDTNQVSMAIRIVLAPLSLTALETDSKWGMGRLPSLVSIEVAERFAVAATKLDEAIASEDVERVTARAVVMQRGWLKLDELATEAGHKPWGSESVWEGVQPNGETFLVVRNKADVAQHHHDTGKPVWTMQEIGRALESFDKEGMTQLLKKEFGAELISVNGEAPF
jgi:hypothetical protein